MRPALTCGTAGGTTACPLTTRRTPAQGAASAAESAASRRRARGVRRRVSRGGLRAAALPPRRPAPHLAPRVQRWPPGLALGHSGERGCCRRRQRSCISSCMGIARRRRRRRCLNLQRRCAARSEQAQGQGRAAHVRWRTRGRQGGPGTQAPERPGVRLAVKAGTRARSGRRRRAKVPALAGGGSPAPRRGSPGRVGRLEPRWRRHQRGPPLLAPPERR